MDEPLPPDDGTSAARNSGSERTCAVTREQLDPRDLIRFVADPSGSIVPDVARRLPGRGVWVRLDRATVEKAAQINVFARSLRRKVAVLDGLGDLVEALLRRRAVEALSLANKAGLVVAGFTKVDVATGRGEVVVLLHASDAAEDGAGRLDRKLAAVAAGEEKANCEAPAVVTDLTSAELSLALGRQNVVHAALRAGGAAIHFLNEAGRLKRYRANSHGDAGRPPHKKSNTEQV
ncbi:MAG: RNA-binding protein [Hyphomicrobiaceae bacterium]|nr:RNA-binding protein [Hyphomicrobiaceae bacterium]